jgi:aromatic-L-amino-acid/L-tryptophan decarboxylase
MPDPEPNPASSPKSYHMSPEAFRRFGRAAVDWIADYMERVEQLPVLSQVEPGQIYRALPEQPPAGPEPFDAALHDLEHLLLPGITHWQSPNFFGYFPANASGPAILGDLLAAGLGVQGMIWATSPACTELETRVLDWLVGMLGLPGRFHSSDQGGGVIQDSASSAALCALIAARERATGLTSNQRGGDGALTAYASTQTHSSVEKAVRIAGIGADNLRLVEVDDLLALRPERLARAIEADLEAGRTPFFVCATVGTTSTNAVDPLPAIGAICQRHNLWLHVDAAMSGTAALCPEHRHLQRGVELADSYCFNPHKWMFTNFDCDCFWVADRAALINALSILPEYLRNAATESGAVIDYRDWQVPLGRRFRALKLWLVIRHYGVEGLQHHVRRHVELAQELRGWIEADERFELAVPPPLNLVCFRHRGGDAINQGLLDRLNSSGELFLTHTRLDGKLTLRLSIGGTWTERRHVERAWRLIQQEA